MHAVHRTTPDPPQPLPPFWKRPLKITFHVHQITFPAPLSTMMHAVHQITFPAPSPPPPMMHAVHQITFPAPLPSNQYIRFNEQYLLLKQCIPSITPPPVPSYLPLPRNAFRPSNHIPCSWRSPHNTRRQPDHFFCSQQSPYNACRIAKSHRLLPTMYIVGQTTFVPYYLPTKHAI